ncbi:phospholipase D-like domain-containing protein [Sulfurovum sp. NBC37-1]|uniref:phospholipase D-like domain-containing protein n=1 Tax=Sulfurovum sp. (strain NBC37-1) TaxID=387093 RepID=UPI001305406F|nr:phospholipase D family protein [Sulfurovum sp. NBC37-1]
MPIKQTPVWADIFKSPLPLNKGSSFYSLENPVDAFAARLYLIDHATASIDVQYYIYKNDKTAAELSYHLIKAAERGVKVRMLVDDLTTSIRDKDVALLAAHPNIDVKLFNPNRIRGTFRNMALLLDVSKLGKRMHNKVFIVDRYAAILGGRNIGDEYFAMSKDIDFLDYEILVMGKVLAKIYRIFDIYWNSPLSHFYEEIIKSDVSDKAYKRSVKKITEYHHAFANTRLAKKLPFSRFTHKVEVAHVTLYPAKMTSLYFDLPQKVVSDPNDIETHLSKSLKNALDSTKKEVIVISPYFIPSPMMMETFKKLRAKDIKVTVITNSMASTDVTAVYSGYKTYINPLLKMGVALYEFKAQQNEAIEKKYFKFNRLSLHTKMIIIDSDILLVGSANLDPRSDKLNTEILMLIKQSQLIGHIKSKIKKIMDRKHLYRLSLMKLSEHSKRMCIVWESQEDGKIKRYKMVPKAGLFRRIGVYLFSLLPIEGYL